MEQRYHAVMEVLSGAPVTEVAERYGVSPKTIHTWKRRYREGGPLALADRSHRLLGGDRSQAVGFWSLKHLTQLFETFDNDRIALVFLDLGMDTSTSQGRLLRNIMASFAEFESDVRADYTRANFRSLCSRKSGDGSVHAGSCRIFGDSA